MPKREDIRKALIIGSHGNAIPSALETVENKSQNLVASYELERISSAIYGRLFGVWDLDSNILVTVDEDFRCYLFEKAKITFHSYKKIAEIIGVSVPYVYHIKNGRYHFTIKILRKICDVLHIEDHIIESHIVSLTTKRGGKVGALLPLSVCPDLACLVGHTFGDGTIPRSKPQFKYFNTRPELVLEVENAVLSVFQAYPISKTQTSVTYSSLVGEILQKIGARRGSKIESAYDVPDWIRNSKSNEVKKAFIKSIFDDDGSILISRKFKACNINLHLASTEENINNLNKFLFQIKNILSEFGVVAHGPHIRNKYSVKCQRRAVLYLIISDRESIRNFYMNIGSTHAIKRRKMETILSRPVIYTKFAIRRMEKEIERFILVEKAVTTRQTANYIHTARSTAYKRLQKMWRTGALSKTKVKSNFVLWEVKAGAQI